MLRRNLPQTTRPVPIQGRGKEQVRCHLTELGTKNSALDSLSVRERGNLGVPFLTGSVLVERRSQLRVGHPRKRLSGLPRNTAKGSSVTGRLGAAMAYWTHCFCCLLFLQSVYLAPVCPTFYVYCKQEIKHKK